uniref:SIAT9 n=1 Tax=Poeciliopsis prolifica TaxID=188132 RepID=A0A0S7EGN6_9TELE
MSYPEGTPLCWMDTDPHSVFVAVIYKGVDLSWISAMIRKLSVTFWEWVFFWQRVPQKIPLDPSRFRLLNPDVVRQTALDFLEYPEPRYRLWGWDQVQLSLNHYLSSRGEEKRDNTWIRFLFKIALKHSVKKRLKVIKTLVVKSDPLRITSCRWVKLFNLMFRKKVGVQFCFKRI